MDTWQCERLNSSSLYTRDTIQLFDTMCKRSGCVDRAQQTFSFSRPLAPVENEGRDIDTLHEIIGVRSTAERGAE